MASIPRRISPTCCPTSRTTPFIVLRTSCLGTLLCGRSARAKKPINTFLNVSTFATWTRSSRLCQYGSDWTLTDWELSIDQIRQVPLVLHGCIAGWCWSVDFLTACLGRFHSTDSKNCRAFAATNEFDECLCTVRPFGSRRNTGTQDDGVLELRRQ